MLAHNYSQGGANCCVSELFRIQSPRAPLQRWNNLIWVQIFCWWSKMRFWVMRPSVHARYVFPHSISIAIYTSLYLCGGVKVMCLSFLPTSSLRENHFLLGDSSTSLRTFYRNSSHSGDHYQIFQSNIQYIQHIHFIAYLGIETITYTLQQECILHTHKRHLFVRKLFRKGHLPNDKATAP